MRSAVADYEVLGGKEQGPFVARPPRRLGLPESATVLLSELPVDAGAWPELTARMRLFRSAGTDHLLELIEVGPDLDPAGQGVYLVSEAPSGGTLAAPSGPLDTDGKVAAVAGASLGAHALHEVGMAHGTIGPESIHLSDRGGLLGPPRPAGPPGMVASVGSWRDLVVVDPLLLGGDTPSRATDVWSLAATLYSAVSPVPLYPGIEHDEPVTAVQRVMFGNPVVDSSLPAGLVAVFEACFDRDPRRRPSTAGELAGLLEKQGGSAR